MKIEFIGPALLSVDGGIDYAAKVDDQDITCYFSYETLEDVDPDALMGKLSSFLHTTNSNYSRLLKIKY